MTTISLKAHTFLHLLRLVSPALPLGSFSYSRGLEAAVHHGWVASEEDARAWIFQYLESAFSLNDGPLFLRMMAALRNEDREAFFRADEWLQASRESRELQMEDRLLGDALRLLLSDLNVPLPNLKDRDLSLAMSFAVAAVHWEIAPGVALRGLMSSVVESQVMAAVRLVPLGQTSGQRIMIGAVEVIEKCATLSEELLDDEIGNSLIGVAMASAWHERQYSRLFRS